MSGKSLKILIGIFVLLLVLVGAKMYLPKFSKQKSPYLEKTVTVQKESIQKVVLTKGAEKAELAKNGTDWLVNGKKADRAKVESFIAFLLPATAPEQVAQTDKRHADLEVTADKATTVNLDGKLTVLIGKSTGTSMYVRFDGSPEVYMLSFPPAFSTTPADWYDKTVIAIDRDKVTKLTFKDAGGTLGLVKKDDKWLTEKDNREAKKEKVDGVLLGLTELSAQSLYDEKSQVVYPKTAALTLTIEYDGKSETLDFFKGASDYLVRRGSDGERLIVNESSISPVLNASKEVL